MKNSTFNLITAKLDFAETILKRTAVFNPYITNQEFMKLLNLTDQDAQSIRQRKLIPFQHIDNIIAYKLLDVRTYVNSFYGSNNSSSNV